MTAVQDNDQASSPLAPQICCPGREGKPGLPFTPHYLVVHDKGGGIDLTATAARLPASELAAAQFLQDMHKDGGGNLLHGHQTGRWLAWDGSSYQGKDVMYGNGLAQWLARVYLSVLDRARQAARSAAIGTSPDASNAEVDKAAKAVMQDALGPQVTYCTKLWTERGQAALVRMTETICGVDEDRLDEATGEIVVDNGRISYAQILRDEQVRLLPHDPRRLVTRRMGKGVVYDPAATCPVFDEFLATSVPDVSQRFWLMWRTVNALFGRLPRKGFVNPVGEHDSGKSTFTRIIGQLGGSYATTVDARTFMVKRSGGEFLAAELRGARFVSAHEPDPGARYDVGYMKTITSRDDPQRTAGKWEKAVQWVPQCTVFLGSNAPVRFSTADEAMVIRHEPVRFARGYTEPDQDLMDKLRGELPGILNRLLSYALSRPSRDADLPPSVVAERERLAELAQRCNSWPSRSRPGGCSTCRPGEVGSNCAQVSWLFKHYQAWADEEGIGQQTMGRKTFSEVVGRRWKVQKSNGVRFHGLVPAQGTWQG